MKYYLVAILSLGILGGLCAPLRAQTAVDGRLLYVPAALLAAGIYVETAPGNAFFSKRQLHHHFTGGHHENDWDDYAQFVPLGAAVQNHFFDFASGLWLVDEERNPVMHFLLYDGIKILLVVLAVAAAGVLAASFKKPVLKKLRYGCILFLLAMAFIPLVIAGAKKATNVYCPYQVTLYGGENPYVKVLSRYPPDYDFSVHKRGHCFPAGHASGGFALMILFFCFKKKKYKIAGLCLGLAAGWGMGLYQMWRGEHFLSHTLCTLFAAWLMCLLLAAFMERVQKKYPAFFAFCGPK